MLALVVVLGLAGFRLTRLVVKDTLLNRPRGWCMRRLPPKLSEGLTCPWCISAYLVGALVLGVMWFDSVPLPALVWIAAWTVTVLTWQTSERL